MTTKRTPRPALSARQVDRVEKELKECLADMERLAEEGLILLVAGGRSDACWFGLRKRLTRLLASVRRSERR